jgi:pimeloyl-ACP methyl ester carboxylesterase
MAFTLRQRLYANASRVSEETVDDWWTPVRVPGTRRAALEAVRTSLTGSEAVLGKVRAPTLVLWGKEDRLVPQSEGLALSSAIAGARFATIPGVGHLPQEEDPAEFARAVSSFLGELPRAAKLQRASPASAR